MSKHEILNDYTEQQLRKIFINRQNDDLFFAHGSEVLGLRASSFENHIVVWVGFESLLNITPGLAVGGKEEI